MKLGHVTLATLVVAACTACGGTSKVGDEHLGTTGQAVVTCASGATVKGVDVSTYQGSIDWSAVHASGRDFAIARVSDGTTNPDGTFATNWAGIKAAGMVRGVYQFFRASEDPTAQADLLVSAVGTLEPGDLSPVADVEVMDGASGATLVANLATWVSVIQAKTGRTPIIYASPSFWAALPSTAQFASGLAWIADWGVSCPDVPAPWKTWSFWQTADNGSVSGISGAVDVDEFNGTLADLQALGGPAPYAAQFVSQSFPLASSALTMTEGQTIASFIELKNVGSKTWDSSTRLATTQARDRASVFADASWVSPNRLAAVKGTVAPGATYKFEFDLHAPEKTGTYLEYFGVVEESVTWFSDPGQGGPADDDLEAQITVVAGPAGGISDAGAAPIVDAGNGNGSGTPPIDDAGGVTTAASATNDATSSPAAGGCNMASASDRSPTWGIVVALLTMLAARRCRAGTSRRKEACLWA